MSWQKSRSGPEALGQDENDVPENLDGIPPMNATIDAIATYCCATMERPKVYDQGQLGDRIVM
jgi:hypothetical protein